MEKKKCRSCQKEFLGRTDKKYCSTKCKNHYNYYQRKNTQKITRRIDKILHRNYEILKMLLPSNKSRIKYDRLVLEQAGFQFNYHTSTYTNSRNKTYYYLYDIAWMAFSTREIMIVQKLKKKNSR